MEPRRPLTASRLARWLAAALVALWVASAGVALAQDATYRRLAEDATRAMAEHRLDDALSIFREMHAIQPSARTLWSLGRVHHELGRYVLAMSYLDQALADARRPLDDAQRAQATELRVRAEALTGILELHVEPADAIVLVDDVELPATGDAPRTLRRQTHVEITNGVRRSQLTLELRLDAGDHVVRVERAGREPSVRRVPVSPGERARVELVDPGPAQVTAGGLGVSGVVVGEGGLGLLLGAPSADVRVVVSLASDTPGPLHVSLQPLSVRGTITPLGDSAPLCDAPCDVRHERGVFGLSVTRDDAQIVNALGAVGLATDTRLLLRVHDESVTRVAGWTGGGLLLAYGLVATVLGAIGTSVGASDPFREVVDDTAAVVLLGTGIGSTLVGLLGLIFALQPDWVEVGQAPL